jgi:hypothetical protein
MGLGDDESRRDRLLAHRSVGETLLAAVIFAVAMGFTWVNHGGDDSVDLAAPPPQRTATGGAEAPGRIPPSQPAIPVSFTSSGEVIRPTALRARIIDPETGEDVVVPLPPGTTVVDGEVVPVGTTVTTRPGGTATTGPGTGTTGTTSGGTPTTGPPTTQPPTTQPPTTQPPRAPSAGCSVRSPAYWTDGPAPAPSVSRQAERLRTPERRSSRFCSMKSTST